MVQCGSAMDLSRVKMALTVLMVLTAKMVRQLHILMVL